MKNFFAMLLAFAMLFTMIGCGEAFGISEEDSVNDENITDEIETDLLDSVSVNDEEPEKTEKVEEPKAPQEVTLRSDHVYDLTKYDGLFKWLPKNKKDTIVRAETSTWTMYGGKETYSTFYIMDAVPQFREKNEDTVALNQTASDFLESMEGNLYTYICGDRTDIVTVLSEVKPIGSEPCWLNYGYDFINDCRISMKEYLEKRGIFEAEIIEAVNENAYLLDYLTVPDGVTAEICLEFDGDYCMMLPTRNDAIIFYSVVYHSDSDEIIPYKVGSVTFALKPFDYELQEAFADDLDWFYDGVFVHLVSSYMEDSISVWGGLPLLKSDSEDAKKINAQIMYNRFGMLSSDVYKRPDNILVLSLTYETTCHGIDYPSYVFNTETGKQISNYDYLISLGIDFDEVVEKILEKPGTLYRDQINFRSGNDYSFKFDDNDTVRIFYNEYSSIEIDF